MKLRKIGMIVAMAALATMMVAAPASAGKPGGGGGGGGGLVKNPILFVHGWNSSASTWNTMVSRFEADGWPAGYLNSWSYNTSQSNATTAQEVLARVNDIIASTGATKVDIISHSMGGLSSRHCIKFTGCDTKIDAWVSLGGPNHGTDTAYWCFSQACYDMRPGSSFLNNLNAGDETPGTSTRWRTWWSPCDSVINPDSSVSLSGATNTKTACIGHSDLHTDATVYGQVRDFVASQ